ncbi:hypothetical protein JCGZ_16975 [Jatropha curcas]|uniref:Uncharacterized protein n=1 Tax=Jatropha curcas TaxID=180498 RepID=A0A067K593_JATCU|nr:hypothetical protein JCGZ_16975 [Jatropha curcas]
MRPSLVVSLLLLSFLLHEAKAIRLEKEFMQVAQQKIHAKAIRLEKEFMQVAQQKIHKEKKSTSLTERSNKNGGFGDVILCKEGQCTGMSSRKLATVTTSTIFTTTTTTNKKEENGGNKADSTTIPIPKGSRSGNGEVGGEHEKFTINSSSPTSEQQKMTHEDNYVDIMDYSPAKRKPPIHN